MSRKDNKGSGTKAPCILNLSNTLIFLANVTNKEEIFHSSHSPPKIYINKKQNR
jgi:hypothetical protein